VDDEAVEELAFDGTLGPGVGDERGEVAVELGLLVEGDKEAGAGETLLAGVGRGFLFAFGGARAGGMQGIQAIGVDLGLGGQGETPFAGASERGSGDHESRPGRAEN
jgi:hypothetical protein